MTGSGDFIVQLSARYASDDELVADLARVAELLGNETLTRDQYAKHGRYHAATIHRRLGSWTEACVQAGLSAGRPDLGRSDDDWMQNIFDTWQRVGKQPSYGDMRGTGYSPEGYAKRYGAWGAALLRFKDWIEEQDVDVESSRGIEPVDTKRATGRTPSLRLRFEVLQNDRFTCVSCGRSPATTPGLVLHVDHITPYSRGGETVRENLQTLCSDCNFGKSDRG